LRVKERQIDTAHNYTYDATNCKISLKVNVKQIKIMITQEKFKIYKRYNGDIDGWIRV
jgi:hypothetical protein